MKKLSFSLIAASAFMMASCSSDEPQAPEFDNGGLAKFTVTVPHEISSRAISDGTTVEDLYWAIFAEDGTFIEQFSKPGAFAGNVLETTVEIRLVNGKKYQVAFWAQNPSAPYTCADGKIAIDYDLNKTKANDETRDAFYKVTDQFTFSKTYAPGTVTLTRPFAQINFGTSDWDIAEKHQATPTSTGVLVSVNDMYSTLNLIDGTVADPVTDKDVEFFWASLPDETLTVKYENKNSEGYNWLAMSYVLVPADKKTVATVSLKYNFPNGNPSTIAVQQVPVQRNYRTNIIGKLLTSSSDWKIVIDPNFLDFDNNVDYVAD